jgi:hypothetical protein
MKRQNVSNGKSDTNGRDDNQNGTTSSSTNGKTATYSPSSDKVVEKPPQGCSQIQQFLNRTFIPLFLMFFSPNLVILLWYTSARCDGSFLRLLDIFVSNGFLAGITRIWTEIHIASPISVGVILGYMIWALLLMVLLPGPRAEGQFVEREVCGEMLGEVPLFIVV